MRGAKPNKPDLTLACLVIDDPLLRRRYGCLNYKELLEQMKIHGFFTEIAFIPWNYRKSDSETVQLIASNNDYFGICVHGCNHTRNEFGEGDYESLLGLTQTALWRMEQHKRLTGLPYDPVFVFPQGQFSSDAVLALREAGFQAAFNSSIQATDAAAPSASEFKHPATRIYHDFPLFLRRYPNDRSGFMQDFESGRPIVVVEHHGAFRNGYRDITLLVDWINTLGSVRWTSLQQIAEHYTGRSADNGRSIGDVPAQRFSLRARTAVRRFLSEIRDNYIESNDSLTKAYRMIRRR